MVCPREVGFFRCIVESELKLGWTIYNETEYFLTAELVGEALSFSSVIGNASAYLVERNVSDENPFRGTRTSILSLEIDSNFMGTCVIGCHAREGIECYQNVLVIGGKSLHYL